MSIGDYEGRVSRLEERADRHRDEMAEVRRTQVEQHMDLRNIASEMAEIRHTLNRVAWIATGGISFFVLQQMGLVEFLKEMAGK